MDQCVITTLKKYYRKILLRFLLLNASPNEPISTQYKKIDIKFVLLEAANAWELVKKDTLKNAWKNLYNFDDESSSTALTSEETSVQTEIENLARSLPGCQNLTHSDLVEWIEIDQNDPGFEILSPDRIVEAILHPRNESSNENDSPPIDSDFENDKENAKQALQTLRNFVFNHKQNEQILVQNLDSLENMLDE